MIATQKQILGALAPTLEPLNKVEQLRIFELEFPKFWATEQLTQWTEHNVPSMPLELAAVLCRLSNGANLKLKSRITKQVDSALHESIWKELQVPFEPLSEFDVLDALLALITGRTTEVVQYSTESNLLTQAYNAELTSIDVLLAFELAGLPAPRKWEVWRKPDEEHVPSRGTCAAHPAYGNFTVHFHNGEKALITTPTGLAEVIRVEAIENANVSILDRLIKTNLKKPAKSTSDKAKFPEINEEQINALAAKWANIA